MESPAVLPGPSSGCPGPLRTPRQAEEQQWEAGLRRQSSGWGHVWRGVSQSDQQRSQSGCDNDNDVTESREMGDKMNMSYLSEE